MHESGLESVCVGTVESGVGNVKYGELILLGYNGGLPQGDRGRRRSKFLLYRRLKANGVVKSRHYTVGSPYDSSAMKDSLQHSISYTLSRHQAVIVEYVQDWKTDLFQIGRSSESPIDFVVMDTTPGNKVVEKFSSQSTISRFACRVIADRDSGLKTRVYAAGFDSSRNIFLGEKATKWQVENNELDGLTTNGVLIMHPNGTFCDKSGNEFARPGIWREVSVGGCIFSLRESRSAAIQGSPIHNEDNILQDGTLIDLCGATLIWRSAEGLSYSPTYKQLEQCIDNLNAGRPQCPVGLHTLVVPRKNSKNTKPEAQPFVYLNCGHVQGRHNWGNLNDNNGSKTCPICLCPSSVAQLTMGTEPAFKILGLYTDCLPPEFCFVPCGHMASERTVKYWASVPIPCGTSGFETACPFCAVPLARSKGYVKLIFQDKCD
ncbi:protein pellino isoform X3 [Lepeophtheirus salmonis]|uniref:protein pellino isoform X3 n=1 Tax=Lepeophtheirus salmonis TaxID=72036 RepID=UPI001AE2840A|nr:protein pellino-like isoform X3 [Lepeophtheirus salmonis]